MEQSTFVAPHKIELSQDYKVSFDLRQYGKAVRQLYRVTAVYAPLSDEQHRPPGHTSTLFCCYFLKSATLAMILSVFDMVRSKSISLCGALVCTKMC